MKLHFRLLTMVAMLCSLFIVTAWADTPTDMNVQGRLTDGSGNPVAPGLKIFTFKIFDAATGGTEIWPGGPGEDQTLNTDANGLWNAAIGKVIPLPPSVFSADTARWLEVTVNDGINPVETLTRIKLNTNPYSFRAHSSENADSLAGLPASAYSSGWVDNGSVVHLSNPSDSVGIGTASPNYKLDVAGPIAGTYGFFTTASAIDGSGNALADVTAVNSYGQLRVRNTSHSLVNLWGNIYGELDLFNSGSYQAVEMDANTVQGGSLQLRKENGTNGMILGGGSTSAGSTLLMTDAGSTPTIFLDAQATGDGSVVLPSSAISASEIADEPGISQGKGTSVTVPTGGTSMIDIVTTTISIPAPGYIVVEAEGQANVYGTTSPNDIAFQIDETAGGAEDPNYYQYAGFGIPANTGSNYLPISARRTYYKSVAGTYIFRLEAMDGSGVGGKYIFNPVITAEYFPTSYGTVSTVATASEASQFESAKPIVASATNPQAGAVTSSGTAYQVDLRDLEVKAARLEAQIKTMKMQQLQDKLKKQEQQISATDIQQRGQ